MNTKNIDRFSVNRWLNFRFSLISEPSVDISSSFPLVSDAKIKLAFLSFKEMILKNMDSIIGYKLFIIFKIKTDTNQFRNISFMQTIDLCDLEQLENIFIGFWEVKNEEYYTYLIEEIIFTYKIEKINLSNKILKKAENNLPYISQEFIQNKKEKKKITKFSGFKFKNTMDFTLWGFCHFISDTEILVYKDSSNIVYHINLFEKYQIVNVKINENIILSFKDVMNDKEDLSTFTRTIKNQEYIFIQGELIVKKIKKSVSFLTKVKKNMINSKNFITMDLETRVIDQIMRSYCVSIYDGKTHKSFYLTDYIKQNEELILAEKNMLKDSIVYLMKRKYHNHRIYLHNFSKFDSIYLLGIMTDLSDNIIPVIRDGKIIDLKFRFAKKYNLFFRDSLLILPGSLSNLAKNFGASNNEEKGIFPYRFVNNREISLEYEGAIPDFKYFDNISLEEYNIYCSKFKNNTWNLRKETIKYCELDCFVLYQIIDKFSDNIFKLFRMDILQLPTISSLAFSIFRSSFLNEAQIPLIHGEMYNYIKKSYTGGSVDVFKPTSITYDKKTLFSSNNTSNKKTYRYDVNSLYPFAMKNYPMPSGSPIYFEGDILKTWDKKEKPYGIFEVEVNSPLDIKIPLLQTRVKLKNGTTRTIAPIGNWTGFYFSDELYNAAKFGYTFKIKSGYLFEKSNYFNEYVDFLYKLKKESEKGTPNYTISKLLLNSLYGRLGMNPISEKHKIISSSDSMELWSKLNITNIISLKNGKELISYFDDNDQNSDNLNTQIKNISVVVSSIVTASARIHMSKFKTDKRFTIYYTDTDSIDIDKPLDSIHVGDELGQMKLEHIFTNALFLSPKFYGGQTENYEYVRIKGLKNPIKFDEIKKLLIKNTKIEIEQEKWYSDISNGYFHIKNELYTIMITENKRLLLFNQDNIFYDTAPLKLMNGVLVDN